MNKYLLAVCGVVVGLALGFMFFHNSSKSLGLTVSSANGLDQQALITELQNIVNPVLGLSATTTVNFGPGALGPFFSSTSTKETTFAVSGAAVGDYVLVGVTTATANTIVTGRVSAANVVTVDIVNQSTTAQTPASSTYNLTVVPFASFQAPTSI